MAGPYDAFRYLGNQLEKHSAATYWARWLLANALLSIADGLAWLPRKVAPRPVP